MLALSRMVTHHTGTSSLHPGQPASPPKFRACGMPQRHKVTSRGHELDLSVCTLPKSAASARAATFKVLQQHVLWQLSPVNSCQRASFP